MSQSLTHQSNTTELFLVRHGTPELTQALLGKTNSQLSRFGWDEMSRSSSSLFNIDRVISSPLARCIIFAKHFSTNNQLQFEVDSAIRECDFGDWDGISYQDLQQQYPEEFGLFLKSPYLSPPPNAEHLSLFHQRVVHAIEEIEKRYSNQRIVLFTHAGVIRTLVAWCLELDYKSGVQFQRFSIDYASITHISIFQDGQLFPQLKSLNYRGDRSLL